MASKTDVENLLLAADVALTLASLAASKIEELRKEGVITADEQSARLTRVEEIRKKVGLPPVAPVPTMPVPVPAPADPTPAQEAEKLKDAAESQVKNP